jgi:hypothetical protein
MPDEAICTICGMATTGHSSIAECVLALKAEIVRLEKLLEKKKAKAFGA